METTLTGLVVRVGLDLDDRDGVESSVRCAGSEATDALEGPRRNVDSHDRLHCCCMVDTRSEVQTTDVVRKRVEVEVATHQL